jgi:hypothetical protein
LPDRVAGKGPLRSTGIGFHARIYLSDTGPADATSWHGWVINSEEVYHREGWTGRPIPVKV